MMYSNENFTISRSAMLFSIGLALFIAGLIILSFHLRDLPLSVTSQQKPQAPQLESQELPSEHSDLQDIPPTSQLEQQKDFEKMQQQALLQQLKQQKQFERNQQQQALQQRKLQQQELLREQKKQKLEIQIKLREAEQYLRQNSKDSARQALTIFTQILARDINKTINQKAKYGMAAALERLEDNQTALEYYKELQAQDIKDKNIRNKVDYSLGRFYLYLNHEQEGRALLMPLLRRTKNGKLKSKVFTTFGMYYLRRGESKRAEENFKVALKYNQENLQAQEGRAKAVKGQGRDWTAYGYYDDYLFSSATLNPNSRKKITNKLEQDILASGFQAFHNKRYHNAMSFFKRVRNHTKNQHMKENANFWIAETYKALGLTNKALEAYSNVLRNSVTDKDALALFHKGSLLFQKEKLKQAAQEFEKLHNNYPHSEYSEKAKEYLSEIHAEISEKSQLEDFAPQSHNKR